MEIIEIGDGVLLRESLKAISLMKQIFPEKKILADLKIMDGGYSMGKEAFELGADIVTVCAAADPDCSLGLVRAAKEMCIRDRNHLPRRRGIMFAHECVYACELQNVYQQHINKKITG